MRERLVTGKILKARGLNGDLKILPYADETERFRRLKVCRAEREDGSTVAELKVLKAEVHDRQVVLRFQGYESREAAERLQGLYLSVPRSEALSLSADKWFVCDLIGCNVRAEVEGDLGQVEEVLETPQSDILKVVKAGEQPLLIPLRKDYLIKVDTATKSIELRLPDGLYEVYRG